MAIFQSSPSIAGLRMSSSYSFALFRILHRVPACRCCKRLDSGRAIFLVLRELCAALRSSPEKPAASRTRKTSSTCRWAARPWRSGCRRRCRRTHASDRSSDRPGGSLVACRACLQSYPPPAARWLLPGGYWLVFVQSRARRCWVVSQVCTTDPDVTVQVTSRRSLPGNPQTAHVGSRARWGGRGVHMHMPWLRGMRT